MLRRNRSDEPAGDRGSAALEFIFVGVLLLVPLVYLIVTLGMIQGQSLGVESGARHVARAVATSSGAEDARARSERILSSVAAEYGIDPDDLQVGFACAPAGATCPDAGAVLTVRVSANVVLPLAPPIFGLDRLARIPVHATAVQKVSTTWIGR